MVSYILLDNTVEVETASTEDYYFSVYFNQVSFTSFGHERNFSSDPDHIIKYGVIISRF